MKRYRVYFHRLSWKDFFKFLLRKPWLLPMGVLLKPFRSSVLESWASFHEFRLSDVPKSVSTKHTRWHEEVLKGADIPDLRFIGWDISAGNPEVCSTCKIHYSPEKGVVVMTNLTETRANERVMDHRIGCVSCSSAGVYLVTTNGYEDMPASSFTARERVAKASSRTLLRRHRDRMERTENVWLGLSDDEIVNALSILHTKNYEHFRSTGFYGPIVEST